MRSLDNVSTRQLLETLRRRGRAGRINDGHRDNQHLESDAENLLNCLAPEVLNFPFKVL